MYRTACRKCIEISRTYGSIQCVPCNDGLAGHLSSFKTPRKGFLQIANSAAFATVEKQAAKGSRSHLPRELTESENPSETSRCESSAKAEKKAARESQNAGRERGAKVAAKEDT